MSGKTSGDRLREQVAARLEQLQQEGVWGLSVPESELAVTTPEDGAPGREVPPKERVAADSPAASPEPAVSGVADTGEGSLQAVQAEALACVACRLHETRTKVVFGVGSPRARLMFIGEGPGRDEDLQGEPFVGRAGQLLNKIIAAMGYERDDVYIANAVKCRPPQNRDPQTDEVGACRHFLMRQVDLIRPEIIVLLGRSAVGAVLDLSAPLSRLRGSFREWNGVKVMCTYHPAYLLRNPSAKGMVWEDMKVVRDLLASTDEDA